jgi:hypothetical protein
MKNKKPDSDELRPEYERLDFPSSLARGRYAKRIKGSSNVILLRPEVAEVFPNEEAVNKALLSLIDIAHKTTRPTRSTGSPKKRASR